MDDTRRKFNDEITAKLTAPANEETLSEDVNVQPKFNVDLGTWIIPALKIVGLDVKLWHGEVDIELGTQNDIITIEGDVRGLDVTVSENGILTVREGRFFRGIIGRDIALIVPNKKWACVCVATTFGDIDCRVEQCSRGEFKTVINGDIDCEGIWQSFQAKTVGGDVDLQGVVEDMRVKTTVGDVDIEGDVICARVRSLSGDIDVVSVVHPRELNLSSKKGDVDVELPDGDPFHAKLRTWRGDVEYDFPENWRSRSMKDGSIPQYVLSSISGDLSLTRLEEDEEDEEENFQLGYDFE